MLCLSHLVPWIDPAPQLLGARRGVGSEDLIVHLIASHHGGLAQHNPLLRKRERYRRGPPRLGELGTAAALRDRVLPGRVLRKVGEDAQRTRGRLVAVERDNFLTRELSRLPSNNQLRGCDRVRIIVSSRSSTIGDPTICARSSGCSSSGIDGSLGSLEGFDSVRRRCCRSVQNVNSLAVIVRQREAKGQQCGITALEREQGLLQLAVRRFQSAILWFIWERDSLVDYRAQRCDGKRCASRACSLDEQCDSLGERMKCAHRRGTRSRIGSVLCRTPQNHNRKVSTEQQRLEQFCGEDAQQGRASGAARARVHSSAECGGASSAPLKRRTP